MKYFRTKQERHSARLTALIALLLILLLFVVGPPYMDPPEEYGVAVNFGTTDFGSGTKQTQTPTPTNNEDIPEPNETKTAVASESIANSTEEVLTSDEEAAIAVKKVDQEALKKQVEEEAKAKAESNANSVAAKFTEQYGDKAEATYNSIAKELNLSVKQLNELAAASPTVVLQAAGLSAVTPVASSSGDINTQALAQHAKPAELSAKVAGGSTKDLLAAWGNAKAKINQS